MDIISEFESGDTLARIDGCDMALYAAAPDLLAACEAMAAQLGSGDDYTKWEDAKAQLLAAITKAKGA
jgi:hypothetical protein